MKKLNKEFINNVINEIKLIVGDNATVEMKEVVKNNDVTLHGVIVKLPEESITPTLYLENYIDNEEMNCREIAKEIISEIAKARTLSVSIKPEDILDFNKVKDRICLRLINKKNNRKMLETIPYVSFCDLAVVLTINFNENMSTKINQEILDKWNKTIEELISLAKENTKRIFPVSITNMNEIMAEIADVSVELFEAMTGISNDFPKQYVLTNKSKINGATCLFYDEVLEEFANKINSDFIVIPSSIHEVILQPLLPELTLKEVTEMVKEINESEVSEEEILSDHAYFYRKETGKIEY